MTVQGGRFEHLLWNVHVHCLDFAVAITVQSSWDHWCWCPKSELFFCVLMFGTLAKMTNSMEYRPTTQPPISETLCISTVWSLLLTKLTPTSPAQFYVLLTVHLSIIFVNKRTQCTVFSDTFISILYMFRAATFPSSGELIVSMRHLVYVTLCRWPSGVHVGPAYQTVIYTEWHIAGVALIQFILMMMGIWVPETCKE